jgi:hypothetical protein
MRGVIRMKHVTGYANGKSLQRHPDHQKDYDYFFHDIESLANSNGSMPGIRVLVDYGASWGKWAIDQHKITKRMAEACLLVRGFRRWLAGDEAGAEGVEI